MPFTIKLPLANDKRLKSPPKIVVHMRKVIDETNNQLSPSLGGDPVNSPEERQNFCDPACTAPLREVTLWSRRLGQRRLPADSPNQLPTCKSKGRRLRSKNIKLHSFVREIGQPGPERSPRISESKAKLKEAKAILAARRTESKKARTKRRKLKQSTSAPQGDDAPTAPPAKRKIPSLTPVISAIWQIASPNCYGIVFVVGVPPR
ncbi:hypothetical protein DFH09DRAFT_1492637 [Mycena vulgaris]|nr:hypothetical protein DFH09DRAFT_1492637 [Mycena vulgaris]